MIVDIGYLGYFYGGLIRGSLRGVISNKGWKNISCYMCEIGKYGFFFFFECKKKKFLRMDFKYIVISLIVLSFGFKYIELREYDVILKEVYIIICRFL